MFPTPREAEQKSFLVLFFKKELPSFCVRVKSHYTQKVPRKMSY